MRWGRREPKMRNWRSVLRSTGGAEIAETAAVLPVLFTILLAIFFFGRAYNIYGTLTQAAQQGARAAVAPDCATCTNSGLKSEHMVTNLFCPGLQNYILHIIQVN